jgi:hypothetical protein
VKNDDPALSLFPRKIPTGFIYTMGIPEEMLKPMGYESSFALTEMFLGKIFGSSETLLCFDTYQFDDYSKFDQDRFDVEKKDARRKEQFPLDCQRAFDLGVRLAIGTATPNGTAPPSDRTAT